MIDYGDTKQKKLSIFSKTENEIPVRKIVNTNRIQYTTTIPSFVVYDISEPVAQCNFFRRSNPTKFSNRFWKNRTIKAPFSSRNDEAYIL